jgi:hypothetical protein
MTYTLEGVYDLGGDRLLVRAVDEHGDRVEAYGYVSATTNHFDESEYADYDEADVANKKLPIGSVGRHLKPKAAARAMTPAEIGAYARRLLDEQHPQPPAEPTPLPFE